MHGWVKIRSRVTIRAELANRPVAARRRLDVDGAQELEVLHAGPPHHTEQTIDSDRFTRQPGRTLPIAEPPDVQNAVALVRAILLDDPAS